MTHRRALFERSGTKWWLTKITVGPGRRHRALLVMRTIEVNVKVSPRRGQIAIVLAWWATVAHIFKGLDRISDIRLPLFLSRQLLLDALTFLISYEGSSWEGVL